MKISFNYRNKLLSGNLLIVTLLSTMFSAWAQGTTPVKIIALDEGTQIIGFAGNQTLVGKKQVKSDQEALIFWDITSGKRKKVIRPKPNFEGGTAGVSEDGRLILRNIWDTVEILDAGRGQQVFRHTWDGFANGELSPDGKTLAVNLSVGQTIPKVEVWDIASRKLNYTITNQLSARFSQDGQYLMTMTYVPEEDLATNWVLRRANTGAPIGKPIRLPSMFTAYALSPDNSTLVAENRAEPKNEFLSKLSFWNVKTGRLQWSQMLSVKSAPLWGSSVTFSSDNKRLLAAERLWDWKKRQIIQFQNKLGVFSPDGKLLASLIDQKQIQISRMR